MNKKTIAILSVAIVCALALAGFLYTSNIPQLAEPEDNSPVGLSSSSSSSASEVPSAPSSSSEYVIPPIVKNENSSSSAASKASEPEKIITKDGDKTDTIYVDPSYSKPDTAPPPPPKPEGSTSTPNSKPEYNPEDTVKPPPAADKPKDGATRVNDKGENEIYVGGFGWIKDNGGGANVIVGDFELSGEKIGY